MRTLLEPTDIMLNHHPIPYCVGTHVLRFFPLTYLRTHQHILPFPRAAPPLSVRVAQTRVGRGA